jgi:hypothetical protein
MTFTNSLRDELRYRLPVGLVVPAQGSVTLWADGATAAGPTHLPFKLAADGGEIGLFDGVRRSGGVDVLYHPALRSDAAYARVTPASEEWGWQAR